MGLAAAQQLLKKTFPSWTTTTSTARYRTYQLRTAGVYDPNGLHLFLMLLSLFWKFTMDFFSTMEYKLNMFKAAPGLHIWTLLALGPSQVASEQKHVLYVILCKKTGNDCSHLKDAFIFSICVVTLYNVV